MEPSTPKTNQHVHEDEHKNIDHHHHQQHDDDDFAFDFSGRLNQPIISAADELFDCGKIKPLDPSPHCLLSPILSPKTYNTKPLAAAAAACHDETKNKNTTRSFLSPITTVSDILSDDKKVAKNELSLSSSPFGFIWYNKWNLKNLLLFRSTSEGSAAVITNDVKNSSFRSTDGSGSVGSTSRRMKRKVSAHEIHYTANRAVAEEMRRKTFLPYKSGLLGCLGFGGHNLQEISSRGRLF